MGEAKRKKQAIAQGLPWTESPQVKKQYKERLLKKLEQRKNLTLQESLRLTNALEATGDFCQIIVREFCQQAFKVKGQGCLVINPKVSGNWLCGWATIPQNWLTKIPAEVMEAIEAEEKYLVYEMGKPGVVYAAAPDDSLLTQKLLFPSNWKNSQSLWKYYTVFITPKVNELSDRFSINASSGI